jgi:hypothetical protein
MATDLGSPFPNLDNLTPPPRSVPLLLRCSLLAGPVTVAGAAVFAFGMVFALVFVPATDLIGPWRLAHNQQRAQGWLERVTETNFHEGGGENEEGTPIFRCDYSFVLPNGVEVKGTSYTLGEQFHLPQPVPGGPPPRLAVTVEYDPQNPSTSRIQGTRTSPYGPWVLIIVLFPVAGFVVAVGGLWVGWGCGRLLRDGEIVPATITTCRFGAGDSATYLPPAEYKNQTANLGANLTHHPLMHLVTAFLFVWTVLATVMFVGGVIFCVVALVALLFFFPAGQPEKSLFVLGFGGFLALWLVMGGFMVRSGWRACWGLHRHGEKPTVPVPVKCTFEFRLPDGDVVQAKGPGRLVDNYGAESPQPALYDPSRPRTALLLSGLWPGVSVGETGSWETSSGADCVLRLLVALVLLAGPFVAWAFMR